MALNNKTVVMPLQCPDFRPHLIEAIVNWCENRGQTPYMLVEVDDACDVPRHLANPDNTMVFCISEEAVNNFVIDDEAVSFQARCGQETVSGSDGNQFRQRGDPVSGHGQESAGIRTGDVQQIQSPGLRRDRILRFCRKWKIK